MLQSKFSRKGKSFQAQKLFTDRVEPREAFRQSIAALGEKPREMVVYYGKGGIGKSALLKKLYAEGQEIYDQAPNVTIHPIFISLEAFDFADPVNVLMAIRNGVVGDCGLFDYAMVQYCANAKLSVEEIRQKNSVLSSAVLGVLNEVIALGTASACIPAATAKRCLDLIRDAKLKAKYKEEIQEISTLTAFELFQRLPYYLGLCLSNAWEKGHLHVLFLDSYESLLARTAVGTASVAREEWLQELFLSSEAIRVVVASRDRLRWDREDPEWGEYVDQHRLDDLSEEDSRWFLRQVPIGEEEAVETIVKNAGGVPLYLDLCVSLYEDDMNAGVPFSLANAHTGEKLIGRYIRHLCDKDKRAIRFLAAPQTFDLPFARMLLAKGKIFYEDEEMEELLDKSIFLPVDKSRGLWKVDESVRLHQRDNIGPERTGAVLEGMLECVLEHPKGAYFPHLALVVETVGAHPRFLESLGEKCLQAVDLYGNMGFWGELHRLLAPAVDSQDPRLGAVAVWSELIFLRRTGRLREALALAQSHPLGEETVGKWHYLYRFNVVQLRHLLGYYDESLAGYAQLIGEMDLIRPLIPRHVYLAPCIKYADLLFLKGRFHESLEQVDRLLEDRELEAGDQLELLRIKGHICRFQGQSAQAELIYRAALDLAEKHQLRAMEGKLYTNLTEALCTLAPERALEWFQKAEEVNQATENGVELGKALAAASAAHTTLGRWDTGAELARQAAATAQETGYRAGIAFALAALGYALNRQGDEEGAKAAREELEALIQELGVYRFLLTWGTK